jgi:hypothetical protein
MSRLFSGLIGLMGIGLAVAACQDSGYATAPAGYPPPPPRYGNPYYNTGYYAPPPGYARPGYAYPGQYYSNQQGSHGWYNQADGRRYTPVTVTNRGQNGNRDDVVQQQVVCGSQYYDGYTTRTAPSC